MSSKNNVNPDHYKTGGSLRQGEEVLHERERQKYAQSQTDPAGQKQNFIPGAQENPPAEDQNEADDAERPTSQ